MMMLLFSFNSVHTHTKTHATTCYTVAPSHQLLILTGYSYGMVSNQVVCGRIADAKDIKISYLKYITWHSVVNNRYNKPMYRRLALSSHVAGAKTYVCGVDHTILQRWLCLVILESMPKLLYRTRNSLKNYVTVVDSVEAILIQMIPLKHTVCNYFKLWLQLH